MHPITSYPSFLVADWGWVVYLGSGVWYHGECSCHLIGTQSAKHSSRYPLHYLGARVSGGMFLRWPCVRSEHPSLLRHLVLAPSLRPPVLATNGRTPTIKSYEIFGGKDAQENFMITFWKKKSWKNYATILEPTGPLLGLGRPEGRGAVEHLIHHTASGEPVRLVRVPAGVALDQ